jgi:hypothetical protein
MQKARVDWMRVKRKTGDKERINHDRAGDGGAAGAGSGCGGKTVGLLDSAADRSRHGTWRRLKRAGRDVS